VEHDGRFAVRVADLLVVEAVAVADVERPDVERLGRCAHGLRSIVGIGKGDRRWT